jgi:PKD repeat protein
MKKIYISIVSALLLSFPMTGFTQDTLFFTDFNSIPSGFTLNTSDVSSVASGANYWIENNSYNGGNGSVTCLGFPFTFIVPTTPSQPPSITGSPNSNYLHILSDAAQSSGLSNCCFIAADGLCTNPENYFSRMSADVSTTGYDTVTISFWWLCEGGNNSFGELYYSTNGGVSWTQNTSQLKYNNSGSWSLKTISDPAWANQATLRFGFRFVNQVATAASDPGFGIDEVLVTGKTSVVLPVAAFTANDTAFCEETCLAFTDLSQNNPTAWSWIFEGASPDTSSLQHPNQICYDDTGTFDVTLIITNASGTDTVVYSNYITVYQNPPVPVITASGDTLCTVPFMAGYQWYFNGSILIPGAVNYCYIAIFPGSYSVLVTDSGGCSTISAPQVVSSLPDLSEVEFEVYPNPASDHLIISSTIAKPIERIRLTDLAGRMIVDLILNDNRPKVELSLTGFDQGMYFLEVYTDGRVSSLTVVVNR